MSFISKDQISEHKKTKSQIEEPKTESIQKSVLIIKNNHKKEKKED